MKTVIIMLGDQLIELNNAVSWRVDEEFGTSLYSDGYRTFEHRQVTPRSVKLTLEVMSIIDGQQKGQNDPLKTIIKSKLTLSEILAIAEEMVEERQKS